MRDVDRDTFGKVSNRRMFGEKYSHFSEEWILEEQLARKYTVSSSIKTSSGPKPPFELSKCMTGDRKTSYEPRQPSMKKMNYDCEDA